MPQLSSSGFKEPGALYAHCGTPASSGSKLVKYFRQQCFSAINSFKPPALTR